MPLGGHAHSQILLNAGWDSNVWARSEVARFAILPDPMENRVMVAAFRKSPSVKQWAALFLFLGIFSWLLPIAIENYREYKSMDRAIDLLAKECAERGGCTLDTAYKTEF
jgi:hypothetical protein